LILQALVGQTGMGGKSAGHCPRAAPVQARTDGCAELRTKLEKILDLGTAPAPLFPVTQPYPAPYPAVYVRDIMVILRDAEVAHPATEILGQFEQPVFHGNPPASSGVLLDSAAEFPVCLVRPDDAGPLKMKPRKSMRDVRATELLVSLTVSLSLCVRKVFMPSITRSPARWLLTSMTSRVAQGNPTLTLSQNRT